MARFDEPHISLSKEGKMEPAGGTFVDYVITVANDGNRVLGPVYVLDLFPPGTQFISSSLRPAELKADSAKWTLISLGIGSATTIDLKLNMTGTEEDSLLNRVQATGGYNDQWVTAENYSSIQLNWQTCCPPQIFAAKTGRVDSIDQTLAHYVITLRNREKYVMAATITDLIPEGMVFQNSSISPSDRRTDRVIWNIINLNPGETRAINYNLKALQSGVFVNRAQIVAHEVGGSDYASAEVTSQVVIGGERQRYSSTWQPPACFGLNCTQQGFGDEWMPCNACGVPEPETIALSCPSCAPYSIAESNDGGLEMP